MHLGTNLMPSSGSEKMAAYDSSTKKGKQVLLTVSSSDDDEESGAEGEEESDTSVGEREEDDDVDSSEGEEEGSESMEEEYDNEYIDEDEDFESDQDEGEEFDEDFGEDEGNEAVRDDRSNEDDESEDDHGEKGELADGELCKRVTSLLLRDVCKGDVVMFKQRVFEKKEDNRRKGSEGKLWECQVEVLWSKGLKPLSTLFPLRIKGRNLYRYKTFRLRWSNEAERSNVLKEKHRRGNIARHLRAAVKAKKGSGLCLLSSPQPRNHAASYFSEGSKRCRKSSGSRHHRSRLKQQSEATCSVTQQENRSAKTVRNSLSIRKHAAIASSATHLKKRRRNATPCADCTKYKPKVSSKAPLRQDYCIAGSKRRKGPSSSRRRQKKQLKKHSEAYPRKKQQHQNGRSKKHSKAYPRKDQQEAFSSKAAGTYRNHMTGEYPHINLWQFTRYGHAPALIGTQQRHMVWGSHISQSYAGYGFQVDPRAHANCIVYPRPTPIARNYLPGSSTDHIFRPVLRDGVFPVFYFHGSRQP
ncbi:Zinc finger CCCH domain-containing protein 62 [Apostasia shenzhenica]|uniref:Zinc finger CCCH domain-containing protein 62 n=1 Tax=Apostasia shenzhenica TaxID=1088818 RepID=A0A2I0A0R8_9ASPA|nr:Zinc finger CCCH domain-containing protein 62 [Apostasia shenzhenica]